MQINNLNFSDFRNLKKSSTAALLPEFGPGCSAAWFSAFDWGSKGREFESRHPDHFLQSYSPNFSNTVINWKNRSINPDADPNS